LNYYLDYEGIDVENNNEPIDPVFKFDTSAGTKLTRIYGNSEYERERLDLFTAMSRDSDDLIIKIRNDTLSTEIRYDKYKTLIVNPYAGTDEDDPILVTDTNYVNDQLLINENPNVTAAVKYFNRPYYTTSASNNQQIIAFDSNLIMKNKPMDYYDSANAIWMAHDKHRDYKSYNNQHIVMFPAETKTLPIETTDKRDDELYTVKINNIKFNNFQSYADGTIIADSFNNIIGYYKFDTSLIDSAPVVWYPIDILFTATLLNSYVPPVEKPNDNDIFTDPNLMSVFNSLGASEYFEDGLFAQFNKYYIEFLSKGTATSYNNMYNMMNLHDPLNDMSTEYLYSPFYLSNTLPNDKNKEKLIRFFLNRQSDFHSAKGVEESYKFLFKLLYNEDVEIETESGNEFVYSIIVTSEFIDDSIIGKRIRTVTGHGSVESFRQFFDGGISKYTLTLDAPTGRFAAGQIPTIDLYNVNNIYPKIVVSSALEHNYINDKGLVALSKGKAYYTMKIKSGLQLNQYNSDILRFVHPVGFPFIGITLITILINSGISIDTVDTVIEQSLTLTYDSGIPENIPEYISNLNLLKERQYTGFYGKKLIIGNNSLIGIMTDSGLDESDFIMQNSGFSNDTEYNIENENSDWYGKLPSERRKPYAPLFDNSTFSFSNVYRGPLDYMGNVEYPNSILYKYMSEKVIIENDSNIKQIHVGEV